MSRQNKIRPTIAATILLAFTAMLLAAALAPAVSANAKGHRSAAHRRCAKRVQAHPRARRAPRGCKRAGHATVKRAAAAVAPASPVRAAAPERAAIAAPPAAVTTLMPAPQLPSEEAPERFFSPSSFWNRPISAAAAVEPDSPATIASLAHTIEVEEAGKTGPAINTVEWSVPIYTVPAGQPEVSVTLDAPYAAAPLRQAFAAVPLPPAAEPARGRDHHLVVWQPSTDRLWEFWRLEHTASGWQAEWGGAMQHVSEASGVYGPDSWPGATSMWGASASSLSIAGGLITFTDLERGRIEHALAISLPAARAGVFDAPAARSDGESNEPTALPEGAHLRLDPSLDLAAMHLPRLTLMLAEAAQRYGIYVRDVAGNVAFNAQDPIGGTNPYLGASGYFEGSYPRALLTSFPWGRLEYLAPEASG
jgi:hypothetical protein